MSDKFFRNHVIKVILLFVGVIALITYTFFIMGCSTGGKKRKAPKQQKQLTQYWDFADILVPVQLKFVKDESFIYSTPNFTSGVLAFKGKVEKGSLANFFQNNMTADNWQMVSLLKGPKTVLIYKKENRICMIRIVEAAMSTTTEIWVAPTFDVMYSSPNLEEGLLK